MNAQSFFVGIIYVSRTELHYRNRDGSVTVQTIRPENRSRQQRRANRKRNRWN